MMLLFISPKGTHNIQFLDNYTNIFVRDALLRVKGVGDIFARTDDFSMRIWLKPDKMASLGLTATDVLNAVQEQNVQVAAGSIGTPPQPSGQPFEYTAIVNGRLSSVEDFKNIIVRSNPAEGSIVYLKDVARVELGKFNYSGVSFVDKQTCFIHDDIPDSRVAMLLMLPMVFIRLYGSAQQIFSERCCL